MGQALLEPENLHRHSLLDTQVRQKSGAKSLRVNCLRAPLPWQTSSLYTGAHRTARGKATVWEFSAEEEPHLTLRK